MSDQGEFINLQPAATDSLIESIKMRQCCHFVPAEKGLKPSDRLDSSECKCGYTYGEHSLDPRIGREKHFPEGYGEKWKMETHTHTVPTKAYGELDFIGHDDTGRKFVRLDVETPIELVKTLLYKEFGLSEPSMLVSITGGAKDFSHDKAMISSFKRGLMNVLRGCGAWIVTGGTHHGAMKAVGEMIYDYRLMSASHQDVVAIGIASWGCIQGKDSLMSKSKANMNFPKKYRIYGEENRSEAFLDPHHTHYILVDDGTQHKYGVEIPFRAKLEQAISHTTILTSSLRLQAQDEMSVPVVQLVLEGGPRTLYTVKESLINRIPVVVVKDSGRVSNVLCHVYENTNEENSEMSEDLKKSAEAMLRTFLRYDNQVEECLTFLNECLQHRDILTLSEMTTDTDGIDIPILQALIRAKKKNVYEQLSLALAWDRVDIARSEIFKQKIYVKPEQLYGIMMLALRDGKAEFVELLLDNGLDLEAFMEDNRHEKLFAIDMISNSPQLVRMILKIKKKIKTVKKETSIYDIRKLLLSLVDLGIVAKGDRKENNYSTMDLVDHDSCLFLFIWAVLMNYQDLAKLFWIRGQNPIATALLGYGLMKAIAKRLYDIEQKERMISFANQFTDLAVGVMNNCYAADEKRTHLLLVRELPSFEDITCIRLAFDTWNRVFISQRAVQFLLNRIWYGSISYDNSVLRMMLAPIFPGLVILRYKGQVERSIMKHNKSITERLNLKSCEKKLPSMNDNEPILSYSPSGRIHIEDKVPTVKGKPPCWKSFKELGFIQRIIKFYTAPVMVFAHNMISYFLFLLLFSYMLLIEFDRSLGRIEIALYVWVFTLLIEEVSQLRSSRNQWTYSLKYYLSSVWNRIDVLTIVLFICAVVLRFLPFKSTLEAARIVYGITLLVFFFRLLRVFSVNQELGPKLEMIKRMMIDLTYFIVILMVFVVSYAITAYAVLHPNSKFDADLFIKVLRMGYWNIYGELFLEEIEIQEPDCSFEPNMYRNGSLPRCPEKHQQVFAITLMGVYILISNVLLLNILIAMFGNTFQKIQTDTNLYWYFQRYDLIREFYEKTALPPPLGFVVNIVCWVVKKCCCIKPDYHDTALNKKLTEVHAKKLSQWEAIMADVFMYNFEIAEQSTQDSRLLSLVQRVDSIEKRISDISLQQNRFKIPVEKLEEKMDAILELLKRK